MIYTASRASLPERAKMWRDFRDRGYPIISTWIDESGYGETKSFSELWKRIQKEIFDCKVLILYVEESDFPLKGALIEVGMAIALGKKVIICLPQIELKDITFKPAGSWIMHPSVSRINRIEHAMNIAKEYCQ